MDRNRSAKAIERHYDLCSPWYQRIWGDHIHHGFWEREGSVEQAQVRLMERVASAADIREGEKILDAGCGLGGSSRWLAKEKGCRVTGITLSLGQACLAAKR